MRMSASSTSSSVTSSSCEGEHHDHSHLPHQDHQLTKNEEDSTKEKRIYGPGGGGGGYANSSMSTLDRSHYQSLPLNGTRRVTVLFGEKRIVVPWKETDSTVGQLAEAALRRYKKTMGMTEQEIRVLRLECASDGGILDMDDVLEEVFDLNYDQILAITDEASGSSTPTYTQIQKSAQRPQNPHSHQDHHHHYAQPLPYSRGGGPSSTPVASAFGSVSVHRSASPYNVGFPRNSERRESVVEVNSFDSAPPSGLRVSTGILRSSLRTEDSSIGGSANKPSVSASDDFVTPTKQARVTLSPEVEKKLAEQENGEKRVRYEKNPGRFARGSDRKSRINDALLEAREKIVEKLEDEQHKQTPKPSRKAKIDAGGTPGTTLITYPPPAPEATEEEKQMGIDIAAVFDEESNTPSTSAGPSSNPSRLSAVQVMKIEENGRVARDGRIKLGDCIREINGRPVSQMSMIRARACIGDMGYAEREVTLLVGRPIESFLEQEAEERAAAESKPILSALQQANTQYIGHTTVVELVKSSNGFGFTVTGRETAKGERLFYIGTVKPHGVALGHLKSGDRLLEINGESTGQFTQPQIVEKLKEALVGEKIKFLVSRVSSSLSASTSSTVIPTTSSSENKENEGVIEKKETKNAIGEGEDHSDAPVIQKTSLPLPALLTPPGLSPTTDGSTRFDLVIPVNGSGSAGLGVSLKARVSKKSNGTKEDCGIFIKTVMHGGAAFKEGRLQVDDRIVGIEGLNLEGMDNRPASEALGQKLRQIGATSQFVKLTIVRSKEGGPRPISRDSSRITVDAPSPSPSSRMSSSILQSPQTRSSAASHSRQSSSNSSSGAPRHHQMSSTDIEDHSNNRLDESEMMPGSDPFDREAPGRKSLSEKRGLGAAADPQHIKLFQEIKHQRQNSAPTSSTQKRSKSQPRSLSQRNYRSPMKLVDIQPQAPSASTMPRHPGQNQQSHDESFDMLNRRSQSMESINRPIESILRGTGQVTHSASNSKVQFMATGPSSSSVDQHPFPPGGSALMRLKSEESRARDKSRRKSVGNAMRNFFGFGNSKSRDASPEKSVQLTEKPRPVGEKLMMSGPPPPPPPHQISTPRRGSASAGPSTSSTSGAPGGVYVDYGEPYGIVPQYPHNSSQTLAASAPDGIRLISYSKTTGSPPPKTNGNSRNWEDFSRIPRRIAEISSHGNSKFFYSSLREPSVTQRPRLPDTSRTPTVSCTTVTQPIAINRIHGDTRTSSTRKKDIVPPQPINNNGQRAVPVTTGRGNTRRPMSTMDYQHLMRTMSMPDYRRPPPQYQSVAEVSRRPRCVVSIPSDTKTPQPITITPIIKTSPQSQQAHKGTEIREDRPTIITCSTRGSPIREAVERPSHLFSSPPRRSASQPRLDSREPIKKEDVEDQHRREPLRRRSMRMLEVVPVVDQHECSFRDTVEASVRRRLPVDLVDRPGKIEEINNPPPPQSQRQRTVVFPSTRFPIAPSAIRVPSSSSSSSSVLQSKNSTSSAISTTVSLRPHVPKNNNNNNVMASSLVSSPHERISLRARKKLHREAVTRSEFFVSPYTNENIEKFNNLLLLLPPSTSSIMSPKQTTKNDENR